MRWRWIVCFLIALVIVSAMTGYLVVSRYDFNDLKPRIATAVQKATGRELTLAGNVEINLGLAPALTIEDVAFQNASWATRKQMATVKRLELQVAIIPLLQGTIDVRRLVLVEPDILIEKSQTGRLNLNFDRPKAQTEKTETTPEHPKESPLTIPLVFSDIRIERGNIIFMDHRSDRTYRLALRRTTAVMAPNGSVSLELEGTYNDLPSRLKATVGTIRQLTDAEAPWPVDLSVSVGETTVSLEGTVSDVMKGRHAALNVMGKGTSLPGLLEIFGVTDVPEVGPFRVSGKLRHSGDRLAASDIDVKLGHGDLAVITVTGGHIHDLVAFDDIGFFATGRGPSVQDVLSLFQVPYVPWVAPFEVSGSVTKKGKQWRISKLELSAGTPDMAEIVLSGTIPDITTAKGMDIDFTLQGDDLDRMSATIDKALAFGGPFHISGHASFPADRVVEIAHLKASVEKNRMEGEASLALDVDPPRINATLQAETLDLVPLFQGDLDEGPASASPAPATASKTGRVFPRTPIPFEQLKKIDAAVDLEAAHVTLPFLSADDVTARLHLEGGNLSVTPVRFDIGEGKLDGQVTVSQGANRPAAEMTLHVEAFDLGRAVEQLGLSRFLTGAFDMDVDVTATGRSVADLMATLDGRTSVVMKDGTIDERLLSLMGGDLTTNLLELANPFRKKREYTTVHCLVIGLNFIGGKVESSALLVDTDKVTVVGHGKANLETETLDVSFKPTPKKGVSIKGLGNLSLSLGQLTKPFKLTGTFAKPALAVDATGTLFTLGKAVGGAALFGPVGLAAALAGGKLGNEDPCLAAIEAAEGGNPD